MSVGLDLGTTEFRSLRDSGGDLVARRCRASYLVLKDAPAHRRLLEHARARFATCADDLVVIGDDAIECGEMLDLPAIPLLREGRLPHDDPVARQVLALIVEAILPPSERPDDVCCLTVPGGYGLEADTQSLDVRYLKQLVALRGYVPQLISSGQAAVLAELASSSFSGLGISLGVTNCEIGVIHCGRELSRFTSASTLADMAGDPTSGAAVDAEAQRVVRETNCLRILSSILAEARESLLSEGSIRLLSQPTSVACTGGISQMEKFADLFQRAWQQTGWPIKVSQFRIPSNPRFTIARGALIKAILEGQPWPDRRAA